MKKRILIVEDDQFNLEYLKELISEANLCFASAVNGKEALDLFNANPDFDLILLDIRLPDVNGYDIARQIRTVNQQVTIIAQSAFVSSTDKQKAKEAGFTDYIEKPIEQHKLIKIMKKYIEFA